LRIPEFYSTEDEFKRFHAKIKLLLCPHCRRVGFLILHGYLYGYGETDLIQRGRRIFCSNRNNKSGCGRTVSCLQSGCIRNFMMFAGCLSVFLEEIRQDYCPAEAARKSGLKISKATIYRLYKRFKLNQSRIRSYLLRLKAPPPSVNTNDPVIQTITHLTSAFSPCIVSGFQHHFQTSFLK
jgi:hypothetical protein